jgi:hypothetical protein
MSGRSVKIVVVVAVVAVALFAVACGGGSGDDGTKTSPEGTVVTSPSVTGSPGTPSAKPSPSASPSSDPATGILSASSTYDAGIGGLYQLLGFRDRGDQGAQVYWVAAEKGPAVEPQLVQSPGRIDLVFPDTRQHADIMKKYTSASGPIKSIQIVVPEDDATIVVRFTLRDPSAEPKVSLLTAKSTADSGQTQVMFE